MKNNIGIYKILNQITKKFYIGSSSCLNKRKVSHFHQLRNNKHINYPLQKSYNQHGEENFIFEILEHVESKENLIEREQHYFDILNPQYNFCKVAGSFSKMKHSEKSKNQLRKKRIGNKNPFFGKKHTEETKLNISLASRGSNNGFFGKTHNEEFRVKSSKIHKGKILSNGVRKKISLTLSGRKLTEEHIRKQANSTKKKIVQIKNNEVLNFWDSATDAAKELCIYRSNINSCCHNRSKTYKTFEWMFVEDFHKIY